MVYLAAQQQIKLIQFPVCADVGVLFTLDILSDIFSLAILVLEYYTANNVTRDPISVALFDLVALFSDFTHLFELLDQVLLPIAVVPFIYWN